MSCVCPVCVTPAAASGGLYCPACVVNTLYYPRQAIAYKKVALRDVYEQARAVLSARREVAEKQQQLAQLMRESAAIQDKILERTTKRISRQRVQLAKSSFSFNNRDEARRAARETLEEAARKRGEHSGPVREGLQWCKQQALFSVHYRMWARTLEHFVVLPIEADLPVDRETRRLLRGTRELHGISTIASVPLPNSGNLAGMPEEVVESALYLVARLTSSLSSLLHVPLPHPISFPPSRTFATVADDEQRGHAFPLSPSYHQRAPSSHASTDPRSSRGGGGGAAAVRTPDDTNEFHMGLEYLQNDVHQLAIKAGVDSGELWAKEALLLNLWAIQQHAVRTVRSQGPVIDLPLPPLRRPELPTTAQHDGHGGAGGGGGGGYHQPTITFEEDRDEDEWTHVHTSYTASA